MNSEKTLHEYAELFFRYQREGSKRSARRLLPEVIDPLGVRSVLDIGCGAGAWVAACKDLGVSDGWGVDGAYLERSLLLFEQSKFQAKDITQPFDLGRTFDLVLCLEVAEHVPKAAVESLVDNIVRHGKKVLFSAAPPGQGGEDHINEQPYEYWRDLFAKRRYRMFDFVRPGIVNAEQIEPWYRYNVMFFAHDDIIDMLPAQIGACRVHDNDRIQDFSPLQYRLRKAFIRYLPNSVVSRLAVWKHKAVLRSLAKSVEAQ